MSLPERYVYLYSNDTPPMTRCEAAALSRTQHKRWPQTLDPPVSPELGRRETNPHAFALGRGGETYDRGICQGVGEEGERQQAVPDRVLRVPCERWHATTVTCE